MDTKDALKHHGTVREEVLRQYETVREEVLRAITNGHHIVSVGLVAVGGMISVGLATIGLIYGSLEPANLDLIVTCVFLICIPATSLLAMYLALGEWERTTRACYFLAIIEREFPPLSTQDCGQEIHSWHIWLTDRDKYMLYPHFTVTIFFFLAAFASPAVWLSISQQWAHVAVTWVTVAVLLAPWMRRIYVMKRNYARSKPSSSHTRSSCDKTASQTT